ncbi:tetratricopeptide repeat-containing sensor histidine kinase [Lutibacter sp.]|uniref:ATP-binding protein n=1 Tax=Lutibacter sp. TaxID=1925666 RepID=UPI0025BB92E1|nr:tetratricopeptide repeat-containing sensor histidine kinase [Lutibacter sp.]MCF6168213.1 tetratricopeptide repeat protein [Lutibacter sp.]
MIRCFIIILLFFVTSCSKNTVTYKTSTFNNKLDSLFSLSDNDTLRIKALIKAKILINKLENDSLKINSALKLGYKYLIYGHLNEFKKVNLNILNTTFIKNDSLSYALANEYFGYYYQLKYKPDSSFYFYNKALDTYNYINDELNSGRMLLSMATIQERIKDYTGSEINTIKSISKLKNSTQYQNLYLAYNNLAVVYNKLGRYNLAIENHQNAIKFLQRLDNKYLKAMSLNNIGWVYSMKNDYRESIKYYSRALEMEYLFNSRPLIYATLIDNLAYSKFKLNQFEELPNLFYKSLRIRDSLNIKDGQVISNIHISEYFQSIHDTLKAIQYLTTSKTIAKKSNYNKGLLESYLLLSKLEPTEKAKEYLLKYIQLSDSLQQAERIIREKFTRIAYETDEITKENKDISKKNWLLTISLIIGGAFSSLVFIYLRQRSKNKELELNKKQEEANVEIYNLMLSQQSKFQEGSNKEKERIAEELHDGILGRLFGTRLSLDSLNEGTTEKEIKEREEYIEEIQIIEGDIRKISHNLKTSLFNSNTSFKKLVEQLIAKQSKIGNFECELNFNNLMYWEKVSNSIKINCYRILQESLQNINKYAEATEVKIEFYKEAENLALTIKDNGVGFNTKVKNKGIGQKNILSRVKSINGKVEFISSQGNGTEIIIKILL